MYVFSEGRDDLGDADSDSSAYWCLHTMKPFGPDDELVDGRACRDASRSCYEPL
jgi:hypothetical protein